MRYANVVCALIVAALWGSDGMADCECPCPADPQCDGVFSDVLDLSRTINVAFRGQAATQDPNCPVGRSDVDASGVTDVIDVIKVIDVAFRGMLAASTYVDPCNPIPLSPVPGGGTVKVESRIFTTDQSGCEIGVYITNVVNLTGLVLPLEFRSVTPGAYITTTFTRSMPTTGRLYNSPLGPNSNNPGNPGGWPGASVTQNRYPSADGNCSSPGANSYATVATNIDFVSPDAVLLATASQGNPSIGEVICLPPGSDQPGNPSYQFIFNVANSPGFFEIDTCCVTPGNHLLFMTCGAGPGSEVPVVPAFTKGVVTIVDAADAATIQAFPQTGNPGMFVTFDGITPSPASWLWDFGDGTAQSNQQHTIHQFNGPGTYFVTAVANDGGHLYYASRPIHVNSVQADFTADHQAGATSPSGFDVQFTDLSTGGATSWLWDFGDATGTSTAQNPIHTYTQNGWFAVTLKAWNFASTSTLKRLRYIHTGTAVAPDLAVTIYGLCAPPRPGFDMCYWVRVSNVGIADATGGTLVLVMPFNAIPGSDLPAGAISSNTVTWTLPPLAALASPRWHIVSMNVPAVGTTAGDVLTATATVTAEPGDGEVDLANNTDYEYSTVVASWDPNDKLVEPTCGPQNNVAHGTDPLSYTIRFENKPEATADAIYVLIVDTLDPNLDWGTLEMGPSIKDNVLTTNFDAETGEVVWFFNGIHLPPNVTPPEGEGYVSYTISPKPGLADGTVISNRAHIRFDYNDWLAAPDAGPLNLLSYATCPTCACNCHADPQCDHSPDVLDVVQTINVAFRGFPAILDPNGNCPYQTTDVDCSNDTGVLDVVHMINVAFRGMNAATEFCVPCP